MKDSSLKILALKMIILSVFGLSTLPFLATVVQYIDAKVTVSLGSGYYTDSRRYLSTYPLVYVRIVLWIFVILGIGYLVYCHYKAKRDGSQ